MVPSSMFFRLTISCRKLLTSRKTFLITISHLFLSESKADKGLTTVIMSREDYVREVKRHLQNPTNYKKLDEDPTGHFLREVKSFYTMWLIEKPSTKEPCEPCYQTKPELPVFTSYQKFINQGTLADP